jgi:membrane-bound acyltransferase YfiQ involved in biofilm formation
VASGLLGAGVVALWFLIFDFGRGEPLFTPGALGSAFFLGADTVEMVQVNAGTVLGYTVVHILAFIVTGLLAASIVAAAEETPPLLLGAMLFFVAFEAFFMGALAMVAEFLLGALAWETIAVGNLLASGVMGAYLWRKHPRLRAALAEDPLDKAD